MFTAPSIPSTGGGRPARKQGSGLAMDPDADGPGVRGWLDGISAGHGLATAFDTRLSGIRRLPQALR